MVQKRDGIKSDGDVERDDDSSSLSDRQEKGRSKNKKKFDARKFFGRSATKNDEEDVSIWDYYFPRLLNPSPSYVYLDS